MVEYLPTRPAINVNAVSEYGETPLFAAVEGLQVRVLLTRRDMNINTANRPTSTTPVTAPTGGGHTG